MPGVRGRSPGMRSGVPATRRRAARAAAALVTGLLVLAIGPRVAAQEIAVSVAVGLRTAVETLGQRFVAARPGVTVRYTIAASGELQRRIEAGGAADVFVSGSVREMEALAAASRIDAASQRIVAANALIAVKPVDLPLDLPGTSDLLDRRVRRIAVGDPRTVAAGRYARESLQALGLWGRLETKMVLAEDVRQVIDLVARGEVDVGFVYVTEALLRPDHVGLAFALPHDTHAPIVHPAAVVTGTRQPALAAAFVSFLASGEAAAVFERLGFEPAPASRR